MKKSKKIKIKPLTKRNFAPFGDLIRASGKPDMIINDGRCGRFNDLAKLEFLGDDARPALSIFRSKACCPPFKLELMERHPLGSQSFIPLGPDPFIVIVAPDDGGVPGPPEAFMTKSMQGVNYHANAWHGVLTALVHDAEFLVVDRLGPGRNLQEHMFEEPFIISI
ncbi:MAG: Ureidoglycolate hydrolase [Rhodospirillaceae bacterium TMED8]|nr:Ureidoglycolate hydrolase [Magnetovibrio sp.]OUT50920.1 MAG: Ureidoglycolate hydrolase [Rhodospirillaceae bacterium TMED8]|tara:strand:- start:282 stop:779 length:498 start_codon:yes stop_codon:yes gene_type:complete